MNVILVFCFVLHMNNYSLLKCWRWTDPGKCSTFLVSFEFVLFFPRLSAAIDSDQSLVGDISESEFLLRDISRICIFWKSFMFLNWSHAGYNHAYEIDRLLFNIVLRPTENISLIWRHHLCRWRAAKFRPILGTRGLWAGRDLCRATPAVTWDLGFCGLIRMTAPFSRLLRHARGCWGPILTRTDWEHILNERFKNPPWYHITRATQT